MRRLCATPTLRNDMRNEGCRQLKGYGDVGRQDRVYVVGVERGPESCRAFQLRGWPVGTEKLQQSWSLYPKQHDPRDAFESPQRLAVPKRGRPREKVVRSPAHHSSPGAQL
jgi:hypothetical protein